MKRKLLGIFLISIGILLLPLEFYYIATGLFFIERGIKLYLGYAIIRRHP